MIRGIHHVALSTPDMERSLAFYRDLLGAEVIFDGGWPKGTKVADVVTRLEDSACRQGMLRVGNAYVELFQYSSPKPAPLDPRRPVCDHGWTHLCFDVVDLPREVERMKAAGLDLHCDPQWVDQSGSGCRTLYMRDPDGNVVELQEIMPGSDVEARIGVPPFETK